MDAYLLRIFLEQVKDDCERGLLAIHQLNDALRSDQKGDPFGPAQSFIHHAAAVSRIFWPPKNINKPASKRSKHRGETLMALLLIDNNHGLRSRTLRDHFEHFDERLDEWAERSKNRNMIKQLIGPRSAVAGASIADGDIIHHYDPETKMYAFRGEKFDIQKLADALSDIYARATDQLKTIAAHRANQQLQGTPQSGRP